MVHGELTHSFRSLHMYGDNDITVDTGIVRIPFGRVSHLLWSEREHGFF